VTGGARPLLVSPLDYPSRPCTLLRATESQAAVGPAPSTSGASGAISVKQKLELLQQLKQRSTSAIERQQAADVYKSGAPRMVDARMYQAAIDMQRKMSEKLSESNMYTSHLEQRLEECHEDLEAAYDFMKKISMEFGTTGRLAESTAAAVRFGVDKEDSVTKVQALTERLHYLEQVVLKSRDAFKSRVPQRVPITWVGVASEVRLVGDFDDWTRGVELSVSDMDNDGSLRTFEGTVPLLPGRYQVKFLVDGEWRLAPDWPMENDEVGETNNVLTVEW